GDIPQLHLLLVVDKGQPSAIGRERKGMTKVCKVRGRPRESLRLLQIPKVHRMAAESLWTLPQPSQPGAIRAETERRNLHSVLAPRPRNLVQGRSRASASVSYGPDGQSSRARSSSEVSAIRAKGDVPDRLAEPALEGGYLVPRASIPNPD